MMAKKKREEVIMVNIHCEVFNYGCQYCISLIGREKNSQWMWRCSKVKVPVDICFL